MTLPTVSPGVTSVGVAVGGDVSVGVGVAEAVGVAVLVAVGVGVGVDVSEGSKVAVAVAVGVAVGNLSREAMPGRKAAGVTSPSAARDVSLPSMRPNVAQAVTPIPALKNDQFSSGYLVVHYRFLALRR